MTMALPDLVKSCRAHLAELTGLPVSSTLSVRKDDCCWTVQIEVVEKKSLPESQDILAVYEMTLDEEGNILDFSRIGMRRRADVAVSTGAEAGA